MKRLYIALGLVALLAVLCTVHTVYPGQLTADLSGLLAQAQEQVERGDWAGADRLTRQSKEIWVEHEGYLHTTLRHTDIDAILVSFDEALAFLRAGERQSAEYAAVNARLITQIGLLLESELPTLTNLL